MVKVGGKVSDCNPSANQTANPKAQTVMKLFATTLASLVLCILAIDTAAAATPGLNEAELEARQCQPINTCGRKLEAVVEDSA